MRSEASKMINNELHRSRSRGQNQPRLGWNVVELLFSEAGDISVDSKTTGDRYNWSTTKIWSSSQQSDELEKIETVLKYLFWSTGFCLFSGWRIVSNSVRSLGTVWLIISLSLVSINARLVPFQHIADGPITIEAISPDDLPIVSEILTRIQTDRASPIATKSEPKNITVCYPVVGCFDNNPPYDNAALEVPQSPEVIDTHYVLFTQESPNNPEVLSYNIDDQVIKESSFNASRWLRIIVHGFINNRDSSWIKPLKDELLKLDKVSERKDKTWVYSMPFPACNRMNCRMS